MPLPAPPENATPYWYSTGRGRDGINVEGRRPLSRVGIGTYGRRLFNGSERRSWVRGIRLKQHSAVPESLCWRIYEDRAGRSPGVITGPTPAHV